MASGQSKGSCASAPDGAAGEEEGLDFARPGPSTGLGTNGGGDGASAFPDVSRRALLGAAVALPLVGLDPSPSTSLRTGFETPVRQAHRLLRMGGEEGAEEAPPPSFGRSPSPANAGEEWERALAAFRTAEAAVEEAGRVCSGASHAEVGAAEEAFGDRLEAMYERLRGLLVVPAPDVAALLVKVELAFAHEIGTLAGCGAAVAAVRADALRLAGVG